MTSSFICDLEKLHLPGGCPRLGIVILGFFCLYPESDLDLNSAQVYIVKKIHPFSFHVVWQDSAVFDKHHKVLPNIKVMIIKS